MKARNPNQTKYLRHLEEEEVQSLKLLIDVKIK